MDSEALGKLDQMLAKDLFQLKVGTLIGGLRLYKDTASFGRCASYNIGGWVVSKGAKPIEVIRTPFYSENTMEEADVFNSEKALELISPSNDLSNYNGWNGYTHESSWSFVDLKRNKPVGVHLGKFTMESQTVIYSGDKQLKTVMLVYSKVLLGDGKVGFLIFNTNDILEKELQLL
jgi:hypothetical protein